MFTDTHCHLSGIHDRGENLSEIISAMKEKSFPFVLDIGTQPGDLARRRDLVRKSSNGEIPAFIHFSCGLWPDGEVIADRANALAALEKDLDALLASRPDGSFFAALGECGLDRFWNGPAAAARIEEAKTSGFASASGDGPGTTDIAGEEELFGLQLDIAKRRGLPVIVHSRDSFEATFGCIRNANRDAGVIHCFSYGKDEARAFLDRGWYLSFPGNITWGKKEADRGRIADLLRYVPRDRLLLETDAPYLAPAPHRGTTCTPLLIEHTYRTAAAALGIDEGALAALVFANARDLFSVSTKELR